MAADEEGNLCRGPVGEVSSCRVIGRMGKRVCRLWLQHGERSLMRWQLSRSVHEKSLREAAIWPVRECAGVWRQRR